MEEIEDYFKILEQIYKKNKIIKNSIKIDENIILKYLDVTFVSDHFDDDEWSIVIDKTYRYNRRNLILENLINLIQKRKIKNLQ